MSLLRYAPSQGVFLFAEVHSTGLGQASDAANITGGYSLDGTDHAGFATAHPTEMAGGVYWQPLAAAETNANACAYRWASTTSGVTVRPLVVFPLVNFDGILASATASTITLPAFDALGVAVPDDGRFAFTGLKIVGGTGATQTVLLQGQTANPREYNVLAGTMTVQCDNTSQYQLKGIVFSFSGILASATATTLTLPAADSLGVAIPDDGRYANTRLWIEAGAGAGQFVALTDRTSSPRQYNVLAGTMTVQCDNTTRYALFDPLIGRSDLTQAVPTSNTAQTMGDAFNAARAQGFGRWQIVGANLNLYAPDNTTVVRAFTLAPAPPDTPTQRS